LRNELEAAKREIKSVTDTLGEAIGRERGERGKESLEEVRRSFAAELVSMEERAKQREDALQAAVDQRIEQSVDVTRKLVTDAISEAIGTERGEWRRELKSALEENERSFEVKLAALEEREKQRENAHWTAIDRRIEQYNFTYKLATDALREGLATERNDRREEVAREIDMLRGALKATGEIAAERIARRDEVAKAIAGLRSQLETVDKAIAAQRRAQRDEIARFGEEISQLRAESHAKLAAHEERMGAISGKLPIARAWSPETVTYQGGFVVHDGACWQAIQDTAQRPGGCDWVNVARAGRDGRDGASLNLRGPYDVDERYDRLDVVEFGGDAFVARRNGPGICPGEDWLPLSARGPKGDKGETGPRGSKGNRGPSGAKIAEWRINRECFVAVPFFSDGTAGPPLRLRDLFQEFLNQTG
jgi:hypothetical protein